MFLKFHEWRLVKFETNYYATCYYEGKLKLVNTFAFFYPIPYSYLPPNLLLVINSNIHVA
jgi:hypothetical protein